MSTSSEKNFLYEQKKRKNERKNAVNLQARKNL